MKNREEYLASIYVKRDAYIAKRKKAVGMALSALCIVFCFCAAAFVMPRMMKKTSPEVTTDITVAVNNAEGTVDVANAQTMYSAEQYETLITRYLDPKPEKTEASLTHGQKNFGYNESELMNQRVTLEEEIGEQYDSAETEIAQEDDEGETQKAPSVTKNSSSMGKYTNEEIVAAAYGNLAESEKKAVVGVEPFVTVTRTSSGDEYYEISYKTDSGKIKITLNAENLEFIKRSGSLDGISATTAAPPMEVTTPAYNPNS